MTKEIGKRVNQIRKEKNMTLKDLSEKTSLSTGFLSQFERGKTTIAVDSLMQIAQTLETNLGDLLQQGATKNDQFIHKSFENTVMYQENNRYINMRITNDIKSLDFLPKLVTILPNSADDEPEASLRHKGQEFIYVLEGVLTIDMDGVPYDLFPGDTASYESSRLHMWRNRTNKAVKILVVHSPNMFRVNEPENGE